MKKVINHLKEYHYQFIFLALMISLGMWIDKSNAGKWLILGGILFILNVIIFALRWYIFHDGLVADENTNNKYRKTNKFLLLITVILDIALVGATLYSIITFSSTELMLNVMILNIIKYAFIILLAVIYIANTIFYNKAQLKRKW